MTELCKLNKYNKGLEEIVDFYYEAIMEDDTKEDYIDKYRNLIKDYLDNKIGNHKITKDVEEFIESVYIDVHNIEELDYIDEDGEASADIHCCECEEKLVDMIKLKEYLKSYLDEDGLK